MNDVSPPSDFHFVLVGWEEDLIRTVSQRIVARSPDRISHIMHPRFAGAEYTNTHGLPNLHFLRAHTHESMPEADLPLLASLERHRGVPSMHNMILGDSIVSTVPYADAQRYATFLARRFRELFTQLKPSVVIGGYDGLHSGIAMAVAREMNLPWFALYFCVIPAGPACFVDAMSPAAQVQIAPADMQAMRSLAELSLRDFEARRLKVPVYIPAPPLTWMAKLRKVPARVRRVASLLHRSRSRQFLQFVEGRSNHDVWAAIRHLRGVNHARRALAAVTTTRQAPKTPYVYFGLHMQPESSIDVWAPFFANQLWVIELLSRSIPASHKLLVKIHKSDAAKYSLEQLRRIQSFPGVELVHPAADSRALVDGADLVIAIQGTIGLEAALLGKPVILLGDSPYSMFPSASRIGEIADLPQLVRRKLGETAPTREEIIAAYTNYLRPFLPAGHNDWIVHKTDEEIANFVALFGALKRCLVSGPVPTSAVTVR